MKKLGNYILIILLTLISSKMISQNLIGVIEIDSIYNSLYEKSHIDSILIEFKISINKVHKKMENEFQNSYSKAMNSNICHTVKSQKEVEKRIKKMYFQLVEYGKYSVDTLELLSNEVLIEFKKYVYLEIEESIKEHKLKLVLEKNKLLYYDKSTDITQIIVNRFKQKQNREADFLNLLDKINNLLLKYNFEKRLNEVLIIKSK